MPEGDRPGQLAEASPLTLPSGWTASSVPPKYGPAALDKIWSFGAGFGGSIPVLSVEAATAFLASQDSSIGTQAPDTP